MPHLRFEVDFFNADLMYSILITADIVFTKALCSDLAKTDTKSQRDSSLQFFSNFYSIQRLFI